jgi:YesN/AraC family two-component response regulator
LLHGGFYDHEAAQIQAQQVGICTNASSYAAILIENSRTSKFTKDQIRDFYMEQIKLEQVVNENAPKDFYIIKLNMNQIVLVIALNERDKSVCKEKVEVLAQKISDSNYGINIYIGSFYNNIFNAYTSYREAENTAELVRFRVDKKRVFWYEDIPKSRDCYCYSVEEESRLINIIRSGDTEQCSLALREIVKENFQNRELSASMTRILWYELRGTIVKLMNLIEIQMPEVYNFLKDSLENLESTDEADQFSGVMDLFTEVCRAIGNKKNSNNENLKDKILEFIKENYHNSDLCLDSLAEHFRVSVSFLSGFFKEQINESFYTILEDLRMKEAKRLLGETDMQIKDILAFVGYSSFNTFGRAFKRINGISPSEYRTLIARMARERQQDA